MLGPNISSDRLAWVKMGAGLNLQPHVKRTKRQALVSLFSALARTRYSNPNLAKPKATKSSKKPVTTKNPKRSKASSRSTQREDDFDDRPIIPKPAQHRLKTTSAKPPPTQTDDESDGLAIKKTKAPRSVDKGKARVMESPPETFESAWTDVDLEDSRPGPSNMKPLSAEEKSLRDAPPDVYETITTPIISRVAPDGDVSDEEQQQKPPPKKRGRPRKDEGEGGPPLKRGKIRGMGDADDDKDSTSRSKPKKQVKKPPPKPNPTVTKGRTRKKADPPPDTSDEEGEGSVLPETKSSGSDTRKRQRRTLNDESDDEKWGEQDDDWSSSNPNRIRLDRIPPEGVIIRQGNGIVERLLPPVMYVQLRCTC